MISLKEKEKEMMKNLKFHQLFSVEILIEKITIEHGPYKNAGDLDVITPSEESADEEEKGELVETMPTETTLGDSEKKPKSGGKKKKQMTILLSCKNPLTLRLCMICNSVFSTGSTKGKKGKKKPKKEKKEEPVEKPVETPPKKRLRKRCPKRRIVEGPLPPLRVLISLFHIKDMKINQVDLEKLYPPEDSIPLPELEKNESMEQSTTKKEKKKSKDVKKPADKAGGKKPSSTKSTSSSKKSGSSKKSSSSKQSKNIVNMKKEGLSKKELNSALQNLKESQEIEVIDEGPDPFAKYREVSMGDGEKCSGDPERRERIASENLRDNRERRRHIIESLRSFTDFKRGLSMIFSITPLELINRLMTEKMEITIERCDINGPPFPIGKVRVKLPSIYMDRVQASARVTTNKSLWTCLEDNYPIIDCRGKTIGNIDLYFCLTSLGGGMVSSSTISDTNLYEYSCISRMMPHKDANSMGQRPIAFRSCYGNLQRLTHKDYDLNKNCRNLTQLKEIT